MPNLGRAGHVLLDVGLHDPGDDLVIQKNVLEVIAGTSLANVIYMKVKVTARRNMSFG